jgi:acetyltransferase
MMMKSDGSFFAPQGIAVIGASRDPGKLGYGVARNLVVSGYAGELYFVNHRAGSLFDRPFIPSVEDVPDPVDLAVILIPAPAIPSVLESCGRRGIRSVVIGSGGFREIGEQGAELETECSRIANEHEIRVLGPNCIGFLDTHLPIDATFLPLPGPSKGDIAFLSHSGAVCAAVIDWARGQGFGLSRLISLGNQMDLNEGDLLPITAEDPNTKVIALYLEGVADGAEFIRQARQVTAHKPVVAIKVGRSIRGQAAVASHTGALAGEDVAFDAAFRKAGVIRAGSSEEMFDWARALAWCPLPNGRRMAVLTNAGGPGAIAIDALDDCDLEIADLSVSSKEKLKEILPPVASILNPVDILASAGPREYADCLRVLLRDEGVDGVMVILPPPPMSTASEVAGALIPIIQSTDKPVVIALMGEDLILRAAQLFRGARIPDYRFPERAASALRVLVTQHERAFLEETPPDIEVDIDGERVATLLEAAEIGVDGFVDMAVAGEIVEACGILLPSQRIAKTEDEAVLMAQEIGYPVAMKILSPDIPHKSGAGGLQLNLANEAQVTEAFKAINQAARKFNLQARINGMLLQSMIAPGHDLIVGAVVDPQFGPLIMFGSGGVEVEGKEDVAFELAPLTASEIEGLINRTWAGKRLDGYRDQPAGDISAVTSAILRLSKLASEYTSIKEIEINPLRVFEKGAVALDFRLRLG